MIFCLCVWSRRIKKGKGSEEDVKRIKQIVRCDKCDGNIKINLRYKRVGDLEYRYFRCRRCGAVYIISVTDEDLRKEIKRYQEIIEKFQKTVIPPEISQEAQLIIQNNAKRSRELKEKYPLKLKPWER